MDPDPATAAFLAFRESGDPAQLGRVFDRLAPELLLVAARLLPPSADPADMVQKTFLTALEHCRRFERSKRLAPWLCGILVRHVQHERRRLGRRPDPRRLEAGEQPAPEELVATRELAVRVQQRVASMSEPYRQALQLHLVHGLQPQEVAAALGLSYRTVQSRLRRGLQQLRRSLPRLAVAPGLLADERLYAVRAKVLVVARSLAPMGWLCLAWVRLVAALFFVLLPCVLLAVTTAAGAPPETLLADAGHGVALARDATPRADPGAGTGIALVRNAVDPQDPEPRCRTSLRVLDGVDGQPIAGASVAFSLDPLPGGAARQMLGTVNTDAAGLATRDVPQHGRGLTIEAAALGHLAVRGAYSVPERADFAFPDLALPRTAKGRVQLRDQNGVALVAVTVMVRPVLPQQLTPVHAVRSITGENGWTAILELPLGEGRLGLGQLPVEFCVGPETELRARIIAGDQQVVLERPAAAQVLSGRVVSESGGVAGAEVHVLRARDLAPFPLATRARVITDASGAFALLPPVDVQGPFRLGFSLRPFAEATSEQTYVLGTRDIALKLTRPPGFDLRVVDAADGSPVEDFSVTCFRVDETRNGLISGTGGPRLPGHHPDGRTFVDNVETGTCRVLVWPSEQEHLPSGFLPLQLDARSATTIRLHRPRPIPVRVIDGEGKPIAGSEVRLYARATADESFRSPMPMGLDYRRSNWMGVLQMASAITDEHGIAALRWQPWDEPVFVRAEGPGHVARQVELPRIAPGGPPIDVRVARGSTLRGTIANMERWKELAVDWHGHAVPIDFDQIGLRVVLRNAADGTMQEGPEENCGSLLNGYRLKEDGSCLCRDVPAGRWQVLFRWNQPSTSINATSPMTLTEPRAEVVTDPRFESSFRFDLAGVLPGRLHGSVLLDDVVVRPTRMGFGNAGRDHLGRPSRLLGGGGCTSLNFVRPDGTYEIAGIPPGDVRLSTWIDDREYELFEPVRLAPGETRQLDLHFRHLVARIRLVSPDGKPVGPRLARIDSKAYDVDAGGWLAVDPVPALHLDIELFPAGFDRTGLFQPGAPPIPIGSVDMDPAQAHSELRLVVAHGH